LSSNRQRHKTPIIKCLFTCNGDKATGDPTTHPERAHNAGRETEQLLLYLKAIAVHAGSDNLICNIGIYIAYMYLY